ncbi:uncharacterized protein K489DRAFT_265894 [Dissoconium aciculare CBS 342.82]|uniref:Uncharacterized protein n=1 Tax=Dissoconium aciculare CBS 342.82 TaxID=1314786 RepID=A0A6J3LZD0_9PEZI|nr:uncharacterized protein K489DRAFT_265894 [Dissoconium aciculare CBS 342.82]KAF1821116.1 hypothetical protein K489DRAFT_265894 [Dissoconium aciculare CBS 342.82]
MAGSKQSTTTRARKRFHPRRKPPRPLSDRPRGETETLHRSEQRPLGFDPSDRASLGETQLEMVGGTVTGDQRRAHAAFLEFLVGCQGHLSRQASTPESSRLSLVAALYSRADAHPSQGIRLHAARLRRSDPPTDSGEAEGDFAISKEGQPQLTNSGHQPPSSVNSDDGTANRTIVPSTTPSRLHDSGVPSNPPISIMADGSNSMSAARSNNRTPARSFT